MSGKYSFPTYSLSPKYGQIKEVAGSIINPHRVNLAIVFVPGSINIEITDPSYDKVMKVWRSVHENYRRRYSNQDGFKLGENIMTTVSPDIWVCHALCLDAKGKINKAALSKCVDNILETAKYDKAHLHVSNETVVKFGALKKELENKVPLANINLFLYVEPGKEQ